MRKTKDLALCAVLTALAVVVMLLGQLLGIGMYAAPVAAGLCLTPAGSACGVKKQLLCALAAELVSFLVVSDVEQNLMFLCFFSWYPALRPRLQALRPVCRALCKALVFNGVIVPLEALIVRVLVPQSMTAGFAALLLFLANLVFFAYDVMLARVQPWLARLVERAFPRS